MAIYNKSGTEINAAYSPDAVPLHTAYDYTGNVIWRNNGGLRVMSYNIQKLNTLNSEMPIINSIYSECPDIVGLQELGASSWPLYNNIPYNTWLDDNYGYAYSAIGNQADNKTGIVSKYPISDFQCIKFTGKDSYNEYREYTKCHLAIGTKRVLWYNTHLGLGVEQRSAEIDELLTDIVSESSGETYIIITGDMNIPILPDDTPSSELYILQVEPFINAGLTLINWSERYGNIPTCTAESTDSGWKCLDNIIISPAIQIDNVWTNRSKVTYNPNNDPIDHIPIIADLALNDI